MTSRVQRAAFTIVLFFTALLAIASTAGTASAAVPTTITQQGRLFDSSGVPITNSVNLTFTLYDSASAGTNLWTETITVTPDDGYFSVQLGATTPIVSAFDGTTRYLGLTVGSDPEMTPRETVSSVPYALHASSADTAATTTSIASNFQMITATITATTPATASGYVVTTACPAGFTLVMAAISTVQLTASGLSGWANGTYYCTIASGQLRAALSNFDMAGSTQNTFTCSGLCAK